MESDKHLEQDIKSLEFFDDDESEKILKELNDANTPTQVDDLIAQGYTDKDLRFKFNTVCVRLPEYMLLYLEKKAKKYGRGKMTQEMITKAGLIKLTNADVLDESGKLRWFVEEIANHLKDKYRIPLWKKDKKQYNEDHKPPKNLSVIGYVDGGLSKIAREWKKDKSEAYRIAIALAIVEDEKEGHMYEEAKRFIEALIENEKLYSYEVIGILRYIKEAIIYKGYGNIKEISKIQSHFINTNLKYPWFKRYDRDFEELKDVVEIELKRSKAKKKK